jgi:hypothetical protein|tara:strand:+ start:450 stop:686 length:237 start_codon:yes stop_codon:yes gene_type:complete
MNKESWRPNLITEDKDEDLVQLVLHSLNHDKKMIRAFAVALLEKIRSGRLKELEIENAKLRDDLGMALDEIARLGGEV